jgi:hypothetical protein
MTAVTSGGRGLVEPEARPSSPAPDRVQEHRLTPHKLSLPSQAEVRSAAQELIKFLL